MGYSPASIPTAALPANCHPEYHRRQLVDRVGDWFDLCVESWSVLAVLVQHE